MGLSAPEVPRNYFDILRRVGRLRAVVDFGRSGRGTLALSRGRVSGAVASVSRDGVPLWSVTRR